MIDETLSKPPTTEQSSVIKRRAQKDAMRIDCRALSAMDEYFPMYIAKLASMYKAACAKACSQYELAVIANSNRYNDAVVAGSSNRKALQSAKESPFHDGEADKVGFKEAYRGKVLQKSLATKAEEESRKARLAQTQALVDEATVRARLAQIKSCAIAWLIPYVEGVASVNPLLVEKLRLFDFENLFPDEGYDAVVDIAKKHRALFASALAVASLPHETHVPDALGDASSFSDAAVNPMPEASNRKEEMLYA